jgi:4-carboxymuconolactone decarboxylase
MVDGDVDDDSWATWADTVGAATVFELTTLVGYYATLALQLRVFRVT